MEIAYSAAWIENSEPSIATKTLEKSPVISEKITHIY
jgi:hypothetical protein